MTERAIRRDEAQKWAEKAHPMMRPGESANEMMDWMDKRLLFLKEEAEMDAITDAQLENWFTYHAPDAKQQLDYVTLREAAKVFAKTIVTLAPPCADTTAAIRKVREALMSANAAIACGGK